MLVYSLYGYCKRLFSKDERTLYYISPHWFQHCDDICLVWAFKKYGKQTAMDGDIS